MKFYYSVNHIPDEEEFDDLAIEYEDTYAYNENELWMAVHDMAHHYWNHHEGFSHKHWPNDFHLWSENKQYLGKFRVDMENEPSFNVTDVGNDDGEASHHSDSQSSL